MVMGAHLLEESWSQYHKENPAPPNANLPCMLCGINKAVGQHMAVPSEANGCPISLATGTKASVKKPVHQCTLVGAIDYTLGLAANSTVNKPCTNRPVQCIHCPKVIASYSMAQH